MTKMDKLAAVIRVFDESREPSFSLEDRIAEFRGRADASRYQPEIDWAGLFTDYGLEPDSFRAKLANLTNPNGICSDDTLLLDWVTSADVLALRAGHFQGEPFTPVIAAGVLETSDKKIVVGVRGGEINLWRTQMFGSGLYGSVPTGLVGFKPEYERDLIRETLKAEFCEEVGYLGLSEQIEIIGAAKVYSLGPTGIVFVASMRTYATLREVQQKNSETNEILALHLSVTDRKTAKAYLKTARLPIGAWEHRALFGINRDLNTVNGVLESVPSAFSGVGYGALKVYAEHLAKNQE